MEDFIYFELNNWFAGEHYPACEPFLSWMKDDLHLKFMDEKWVKENKLVVVMAVLDMSLNFCITAPRKWVEENCPMLLTEYAQFIRTYNDKWKCVPCRAGYFNDYKEEYIGVEFAPEEDYDMDYENEEEDELC